MKNNPETQANVKLFQELSERFSVIPIKGKIPFEDNWTDACTKKRAFNPKEYRNKNAGICGGPASGVVVIDVDDPACFKSLRTENGLEVPETFTVRTGNGYHLYYHYPQDGREYGSKSFKHPIFSKATIFDIKGCGGMVVAPGSIHPDTGKAYTIEKDIPTAPAPEWLRGFVLGDVEFKKESLKTIPLAKVSNEIIMSMKGVSDAIKKRIIEGAPKGARSESIMSVLKALCGAGIHKNIIVHIFDYYAIGEKYREKGNSRDKWLKDEIERAKDHNAKNQQQPQKRIIEPIGISAADLMTKEFKPIRWIIPGILPEGTSILAAKPKHGKSIFSLNASLTIPSGGLCFGQVQIDPGPVLYLALEDTERRLKKRIRHMIGDRAAPKDLYLFTKWPRIGEGGRQCLRQKIEEVKDLRLIIIDTLKKFKPIDAGRNRQLYDVDYESVSLIKEISDEFNIGILIIHHTRKSDADDIFDTISGSTGLTAAADNILILERKTGQMDAILHVNGRDVEPAELALRFEASTLSWFLLGDAAEVKATEKQQRIFDALKSDGAAMTPKQIANATGEQVSYVKKILPKLIQEGSVLKNGHGSYSYNKNYGYDGYDKNKGYHGYDGYDEDKSTLQDGSYPGDILDEYDVSNNNNNGLTSNVPKVPKDTELFKNDVVAI